MYRKDLNERSPMRVFEESMHGGLGRGNLGVVCGHPGVGKTPFLVQVALDNLLRDRRVLHISHEHAVDHVRAYYDEIFNDLSALLKLESPEVVKLDIERHRLIYSLMSQAASTPPSRRGGRSSVAKILEVVRFAREVAHFSPDTIVLDHFDLEHAAEEAITALRGLARERDVELWLSAHAEALSRGTPALPAPLDRFADQIAVAVFLQPEREVVRVRLVKGHVGAGLADLNLRLDPHTMRVLDEDLAPPSERPLDPRRFRMISGGSKGAEAEFGACAERWGMTEVNYTFQGHRFLERRRGVVLLGEDDLKKGDLSLVNASRRLHRTLSEIPLVRSVLQTIWHQITNAGQVFVVGEIQADNTVRGGTGWSAELARLWKKPLFVFDQHRRSWFRWSGSAWEIAPPPAITAESFAGVGTQKLNDDGRAAIQDLFSRSFGEPSTSAEARAATLG